METCNNMNELFEPRKEPLTSYGIINVHLTGELNKYTNQIKSSMMFKNENVDITNIENLYDPEFLDIYDQVDESLMFLLVSRKHSLGFVDFIKGLYEPDNVERVEQLFVQMTTDEIEMVVKNNYDYLWTELWQKNIKKSVFSKDFSINKEKHKIVMEKYNIEEFKPKFPIKEWGFPKGRKNGNESNITCALRECCEETSLFKSEITILPGVFPLTELLIGTNGLPYKHVYYLSLTESIRFLDLNNDVPSFVEIDCAGWFKKERTINLIRPYHVEKLKLIDKITYFLAFKIYELKQEEKDKINITII